VGRLLAQPVMLTGARRVFEMGSSIGTRRSGWSGRRAPAPRFTIATAAEARRREAAADFAWTGLTDRIRAHVGNALTDLAGASCEFAIIFNDSR
jgi:predicted O-methyltransferase YrrM